MIRYGFSLTFTHFPIGVSFVKSFCSTFLPTTATLRVMPGVDTDCYFGALQVSFDEPSLHARNFWPLLLTTNKDPQSWGAVLHDADLAAAIMDRLLHRGEVLKLEGRSYRQHRPGKGED